jgi:hypothetical protein
MGVTKTIITEGSGASPQKGDRVTMEYTGWLRTAGKPEEKGKQFDSTTGRGSFQTPIGVGRVIKGEFVYEDDDDDDDDDVISVIVVGSADNHGQAGTRVLCR